MLQGLISESKTFDQRYEKARGDHAKMFYLRAKETLNEKVDPMYRNEGTDLTGKLEQFVNLTPRDKKWYEKYAKFRMTFDKAMKDNQISREELSELKGILENDSTNK